MRWRYKTLPRLLPFVAIFLSGSVKSSGYSNRYKIFTIWCCKFNHGLVEEECSLHPKVWVSAKQPVELLVDRTYLE